MLFSFFKRSPLRTTARSEGLLAGSPRKMESLVIMNNPPSEAVPPTLLHHDAPRFWLAVILTGTATGIGAILLTRLLELVQRLAWGGSGTELVEAVERCPPWRHVAALIGAGLITGAGQIILKHLTSANGIDTTTAIWFYSGRLPALRILGSAILSVIIVGMGTALGREGAPKQAGAVFANFVADKAWLSDERRRLLVACAAGAGMAAAYGVPVGGALFALEVLRGALALRYVLPALCTSMVATGVAWLGLPNVPTYRIPAYETIALAIAGSLLIGFFLGLLSVVYVRAIAWADRNKPSDWQRVTSPVIGLGLLGIVSIWLPQVLGNGRDISEQVFTGEASSFATIASLFVLRPVLTVLCIRTGAPGGLFTPSLTVGALFGALAGMGWSVIWPGTPIGLFAVVGAGSLLGATTQGPLSTVVLLMELTGRDRSFILPLLLGVVTATLTARTIELRSIYEARLTDSQIQERRRLRES